MSIREGDRTDLSSVINLIPIERKKNTKGPFKSGSFANVSRVDITRGITETSREYVAEKTREQLRGVAASAANTDISSIRDTVLHLESIMAKNTAAKLDLVTNAIDAKETVEDSRGELGFTSGGAGLDQFGVLMLYPTKSGGPTWFSSSWDGNPRNLTNAGGSDPHDPRVTIEVFDPSTIPLVISGDATGIATVEHTNILQNMKLKIADAWLNTEQTIFMWIDEQDTALLDIQARSRSRHDTPCNFGGYSAKWTGNVTGSIPAETVLNTCTHEVEVIHPFRISHLDERPLLEGLPRNQWIGFKEVTRTTSEGISTPDVVCEAYINYDVNNQTPSGWVLTSKYQFSQTLPIPSHWAEASEVVECATLGDGTADDIIANNTEVFAYLSVANMGWWSIDFIQKIFLRHASIREIDPLP